MKIMFEFEGRAFELILASGRPLLVVDGDIWAGQVVTITGDPKKPGIEQIIAERKKELQRCRECGRATKSSIRSMEDTIRLFERIGRDEDFKAPRPTVR